MIDLSRLKFGHISRPVEPPGIENDEVIDFPTVVLVEGKDDVFFFDKLFSAIGIDAATHRILPVGGKHKFGRYIQGLLQRPPVTLGKVIRVAIIGDADNDVAKTEKELSDQLKDLGFQLPANGGWLGGKPKIGRLLLGHEQYVCLDSFCHHIASGDPAMKEVASLMTNHQGDSNNNWKRRCVAYLAAKRTGKNLLTGTGAGYFDDLFGTGHPDVSALEQKIKKFLN